MEFGNRQSAIWWCCSQAAGVIYSGWDFGGCKLIRG